MRHGGLHHAEVKVHEVPGSFALREAWKPYLDVTPSEKSQCEYVLHVLHVLLQWTKIPNQLK